MVEYNGWLYRQVGHYFNNDRGDWELTTGVGSIILLTYVREEDVKSYIDEVLNKVEDAPHEDYNT